MYIFEIENQVRGRRGLSFMCMWVFFAVPLVWWLSIKELFRVVAVLLSPPLAGFLKVR